MILGLFRRRDPNAAIVDALYLALSDAARRPAFYARLGVPDSVEGRFDLLTLHAVLLLRRLKALPPPAGDLAQDLVDAIFKHFDAALRELGVGDIVVPKRMKTLAGAFYGRGKAYEDALVAGDDAALQEALSRNLYNGRPDPADAPRLMAAYVRDAAAALDMASFDDLVAARLPFPPPPVQEDVP
ncbi:ubiquinol-cytochrome C chaperone family protein [Alsobacter sp. R-9]